MGVSATFFSLKAHFMGADSKGIVDGDFVRRGFGHDIITSHGELTARQQLQQRALVTVCEFVSA